MILSQLLTKAQALWVIQRVLWVVPIVLQVAIATAMLRRKLVGIFPVFFGYTVLVSTRDILLFFLPNPGAAYFLVYWWGEALAVLLGLGVIFETLRHLFPPYPFLGLVWKLVWILGGMAAVTSLLLLIGLDRPQNASGGNPPGVSKSSLNDASVPHTSLGTAASGSRNDPTKARRVFDSIMFVERAARFLQVCLLIIVIALMSRLGLTWQQYSLGIVAGFGIFSALDLAALEFSGHLHFMSHNVFVLIRSAAYNLGALIWAGYFLRSWSRTPVGHLPKTNLAEWNEAVTEYVDQWYRRS
jgi:hypothetical protein